MASTMISRRRVCARSNDRSKRATSTRPTGHVARQYPSEPASFAPPPVDTYNIITEDDETGIITEGGVQIVTEDAP